MDPASTTARDAIARFLRETSKLPVQVPEGLVVRTRVVRAREPLVRAGEPSDRTFVVYHGLFEARVDTPTPRRLSWMSRGAWIGEIGALTGEPRTASVFAWRDSVVLEFDAATTQQMLTGNAARVAALTRHLMALSQRARGARPWPFVLGLVALAGEVLPLREAVAALPEIALVDSRSWHDDDPSAIAALEARGEAARLLVMVADPTDSPWTRMVVRAADRVAALASTDTLSPSAGARERELGLPAAARSLDLLLIQGSGDMAESFSASRRLDRVAYTVRGDNVQDVVDYLGVLLAEHAQPEQLRRYELFTGLDDGALAQVQEAIQWRVVQGGEELIRAGDEPDGIYFVSLGRLRASTVDAEGERVDLSESGEGETIGEMALLLEGTRTADVHAQRDSRVGFIPLDAFSRLQAIVPQIGTNIARVAARRSLAGPLLSPAPAHLALLRLDPCAASEAFVRAFVRAFEDVLGRRVVLVTRARIERDLGVGAAELRPGEPGYRRLIAWLHRVSSDHEVVLFECTADDSVWARCCHRQADRAVLIASASADPTLRQIERELAGSPTPVELVLLQRAGITQASGTRRWLAPRQAAAVHHVRDATPADVAATARRVMGCANGIAFAGASSRASAHCGVARACATLGLPIDIVAGTSAGSAIAGTLSTGRSPKAVLELSAKLFESSRIRLRELQPPITALTDGRRFDELFHSTVGDIDIEDLLVPCRLSAVDLLKHELHYLERGPLWRAMRASCSVPVLYPPVTDEGRLLVDGGLISYIPINAILPRCQRGLAIMSDVSDPTAWRELGAMEPYGTQVSGWRQLVDRLLPWRKHRPVPKLEDILFLSLIVSNSLSVDRLAAASRHPAVCHVYQPLTGYGMFEVTVEVARKFEAMTYERAHADIGAWLAARDADAQKAPAP